MKVFVSGKIGTEQHPERLMRQLEAAGHTITFDWTTIDHLRPYEKNGPASAKAATLELAGVAAADVLIVLSHERGAGMFVELGAALALGKPVVLVERPPSRTMFSFHPLVRRVSSVNEVLPELRRLSAAHCRSDTES